MISNRKTGSAALLKSLYICVLVSLVDGSFLDYFLPTRGNDHLDTGLEAFPSVPYELTTNDEKFLQEAIKLIGSPVSELDVCHHRVILKLRKSCSELNAEQLGKLSVMLLNCQSNSEGRVMYECSENMNLKDCTLGMDSDTWNAYHLITNRAKAVCAAVRQEQFRGLTEITVNKLMHSAHEQISMMDQLSENQQDLQKATTQAIDELADRNGKLLNQQESMLKVSDTHRAMVEGNLREIMREKSLIRSGQVEVVEMITRLKDQLDESLSSLKQQSKESKRNHEALSKDLDDLHQSAFKITDKITDTTEYILTQNEIAAGQFDVTKQQLEEISETIGRLVKILRKLETDFDTKLSWISERVGGTEALLDNIHLIMKHLGYLLIGMLALVFVNAPAFYRLVFILAVPSNFACNLFNVRHLDLLQLTQAILAIYAGNLLVAFIQNFKNPFALGDKSAEKEKLPEEQEEDELDNNSNHTRKTHRDDDYYVNSLRNRYRMNGSVHGDGHESPARFSRERSLTPLNYFPPQEDNQNDSRSATPYTTLLNNRHRCVGQTIKGDQCRHAASGTGIYCRVHDK